jgi:hypothetical protein
MTDISLRFKLTFEDYLGAQQLHAKRGLWPRILSFVTNWLYLLLGFSFLGLAFLEWRGHATGGSVVSSVFVGVILVGCRFHVRWKYRRCYQRTRAGSGNCSLFFGEDNFLAEKHDYSKGEYNWSAVKSWRENAKVVLLYLAPALFIAIPKRAISEPQLQELRSLLDRKIMRAA